MQRPLLAVRIRQIRFESAGVASFELDAPDGAPLPGYAAGAHIDVRVPGGALRSYSLVDPPVAGGPYRIAVKREADSRGGSRWFHEVARVGMPLEIASPANSFALVPDAPASVFIAGGIGITPLLSMVGQLVALGRPWQLHYAAASRAAMPFQALLAQYAARGRGQVVSHFSDGGGGRMGIEAIVAAAPADAHLYCCGPASMVDAFIAAGRQRAPETMHYERFVATQVAATAGGFTLNLARDGRCLPVPAGQSILDVLLDAGVDVPYSCTQGVCGTCRVGVLAGEPEHRDDYLSDTEKAANDAILVCCSGARSSHLTLDL